MYTVVPSVWPLQGRTILRGDIVDGDQFGGRADSFRRLGLITPITTKVEGTKKELMLHAEDLGIKVPKDAAKAKIIELIEGAT